MSREGGRLDSNILVLIVDDVKGGTERERERESSGDRKWSLGVPVF